MRKYTYCFYILVLFNLTIVPVYAKYCGAIKGKYINTYGNLSCGTAKKVYRSFLNGHIPQGWTCGQSVGGCGKGKQGFYFTRHSSPRK